MSFNDPDKLKEIIDGCKKGNRKYQEILYKETYGKMLSVCMRYASSKDEAKDLLHDGYIKVFEKIKNFKQTGSVEGWIRRIIINNTIDYIRKRNKITVNNNSEDILNNLTDKADEDMDYLINCSLKAQKIIELLQELSPAYKTVFNLYVIENYSHKEIAEILNINIGTSKSNLAKAKINLKKLFIEKYGDTKQL